LLRCPLCTWRRKTQPNPSGYVSQTDLFDHVIEAHLAAATGVPIILKNGDVTYRCWCGETFRHYAHASALREHWSKVGGPVACMLGVQL
jgi:hypothetical protein